MEGRPLMANELDELMSRLADDPIGATPRDIDGVIAYCRKYRANLESGVKPKRETGPKAKIDLAELGLVKAAVEIKRRI